MTAAAKIHEGLSFDGYRELGGHNFSTLKEVSKSSKAYLHAVEHGGVKTPAFALGNAAHTAVLEPKEWMKRYALLPDSFDRVNEKTGEVTQITARQDKRIKEFAEFQAAATKAGKGIITEKDHDVAVGVAQSVMMDDHACSLLRGRTKREVTINWEARGGFQMRSRLDLVNFDKRIIVDLKTAADITPDKWFVEATRYLYLAQFAMYVDAWHAATGEAFDFEAIVVEKKAPYDVMVVTFDEQQLEAGRLMYLSWLEEVAKCTASNKWPGVSRGHKIPFRIPKWGFGAAEDGIDDLDLE